MMDLTVIMVVGSVILYLITVIIPKRRELIWLSMIVSVCGIASVLIDDSLTADTLALLIVPVVFTFLMSGAKAMGLFDRW